MDATSIYTQLKRPNDLAYMYNASGAYYQPVQHASTSTPPAAATLKPDKSGSGILNGFLRKFRWKPKNRTPISKSPTSSVDNDSENAVKEKSTSTTQMSKPLVHINAANVIKENRVVAIFDFEGNLDEDLPFQKGDELVFLNPREKGPWFTAENCRTGKRGLIPENFVVPVEDTMKTYEWYFECDRRKAERMMLPPGLEPGTFMIRKASDGHLALSVKGNDNNVKHYKIITKTDQDVTTYYISHQLQFDSLEKLIDHYKQQEDGIATKLRRVCPKRRPSIAFNSVFVPRKLITLSKKLGAGVFGEVWLGRWKTLQVAVKTIKSNAMDEAGFLAEARTMHELRHPKLVTLYCICSDGPLWIVSEYMNKGSLKEFLHSEQGQKTEFLLLVDFLAQIAEGMKYLEDRQYVHRDLRAANVLVNSAFEVKIADFGLARSQEYDFTNETKFPLRWTAPEAAHQKIFTSKSDVWSYGILIYEVLTYGAHPYAGMTGSRALRQINEGYRLEKPVGPNVEYPDRIYQQQLECWNREPQLRPSFDFLRIFMTDFIELYRRN